MLALMGLLLGALVGSFIGTILIRWPEGRSAIGGRSACDGCGSKLAAYELVPIFSSVLLRGRCRRCGAGISPLHLWMELSAALIGGTALLAHPGLAGLAGAVFGWWLLLLAALDARHHWLPDRLTLPLIPAGLIVAFAEIGPAAETRILGAAVGYLSLFLLARAYRLLRRREGLGGGDPKLLAAIGAWLGWTQLPFVLLGAGLLGLSVLLLARTRGRRLAPTDRLPLGSLMAVASWPLWLLSSG